MAPPRSVCLFVCIWSLALATSASSLFGLTSELFASAQAGGGEAIYSRVVPGCVWLWAGRDQNRFSTGTGVLVDCERRLIVTNQHVVGAAREVYVLFPQFSPAGRLIAERQTYVRQVAEGQALRGSVLARKPQQDLALIQVPRLPANAYAVPLSGQRVRPGQRVHAIGNPGASNGGMWLYTEGKVRQAFFGELRARSLRDGDDQVIRAYLIETTNPTNEGDSGGPLVNDQGELVGITQGGARDARLLSFFIDASEVKALLAEVGVRAPKSGPFSTANVHKQRPPDDAQEQERQARLAAQDLQSGDQAKLSNALKVFSDGYALIYTDVLAETLPRLDEPARTRARAVLARRLAALSRLAVQAYLQAPDAELRGAAATAVSLKRDRALLPDLIPLVEDKNDFVAAAALQALRELTGQDAGRSAANWRRLLFPPP